MAIEDFISKVKGSVKESEEALEENDGETQDDDLLPPDPPPARKRTGQQKPPVTRVNAALRRQVSDQLTMMITIPAGIAMVRDPVCAGAVLEQVDAVVGRMVPIVCRNPGMLRWFAEGVGFMDWLGLAAALAPIGRTIWAHHVTGSIGDQEEEDDDFSRYTAQSPVFAA